MSDTGPPKIGSLRRRVVVSTVVVLALALLVGSLLVILLFQARTTREESQLLRDRTNTAVLLAQHDVLPRKIARRVSGGGAIAKIVTVDGEILGPAANLSTSSAAHAVSRTQRLPTGAEFTIYSTTAGAPVLTDRLRRVLLFVGIGTIVVTALALLATVRVALRPLERMTALAHGIATGSRGQRLGEANPKTELGRISAVFDEMLNALEGAEAKARTSEARTRSFVADAAHELRTPVAGVRAAAEALVHAPTNEQDRERLAVLAVREANRAAGLVEDLLSLAKIDAGLELRHDLLDLLALARTEVERTALLAPKLRCTVQGTPVTVRGDGERLAQVLTNLLDNARRHTPDGGALAVYVRGGPAGAELAVTDTGPGVPEAARDRVFDRMVRLHPVATGHSGLGLPIARGIAHAHGGDLRCVAPFPGEGARFVLTLPPAHH